MSVGVVIALVVVGVVLAFAIVTYNRLVQRADAGRQGRLALRGGLRGAHVRRELRRHGRYASV